MNNLFRQFLFLIIFLIGTANLLAQQRQNDIKYTPKSDVFLQGFYWNSNPGGIWWDSLASLAPKLASAGFGGIWFPSPAKGAGGGMSMGYDPYDHYDFGEFNQKGSRETRFGSRQELINAISSFHDLGIQVFADAVVRHMMGGENKIPYECIPSYNGHNIVPDSAFMYFTYPNGSGRFKKNAGSFYPNSLNCWVDPLFVAIDPIFRFGEWLDHNKPAVRDSLIEWGKYLRNTLKFDGFRLDAVKAIDPVFMANFLKGSNSTGYAVAEYWGSIAEIGNWLNIAKNQQGASVAMFDFPLRYVLKDMCNNRTGTFNMTNLDGAGLVNSGFSGFDVSTFVENHDFDRIGWDGTIDNGHDPILYDKHLAYAYTIFSEGRPCVFYKDYVSYGYSGVIDTLIWIRQHFLAGGTTKRGDLNAYYIRQDGSQTQSEIVGDVYVAKRNGYGTQPGGYLVLNDNPTQWIDVWVNTTQAIGTKYKDYAGKDVMKTVVGPSGGNPSNRVKLWCPPRSFTLYVSDTTQNVSNPPALLPVPDQLGYTNSQFNYKIKAYATGNQSLFYTLQGNAPWLAISNSGLLYGTPGYADTGITNIVLTVKNSANQTAIDTFKVTIKLNRSPQILLIPNALVKATNRFQYQTIATDPDNDTLKYYFGSAPSWLNVGQLTGLINGTPGVQDTGTYLVQLKVDDSKGAFDSTFFNLKVKANIDSVIATYGHPKIDGIINVGTEDWSPIWKVVADSDTDSFWNPRDTINNELLGIYATWDSDSLYIAGNYVLNDRYNSYMMYIDAGIPGGVTDFNSNNGYAGDYPKNFRFRASDGIDFFIADYNQASPSLFKCSGLISEDVTPKINGKRGLMGYDNEVAIAWNDIYGLGPGTLPIGIKIKLVSVIAGGYNWGSADSAPDNPDSRGTGGPDSLINFVTIEPDKDNNGIPDPTLFITGINHNNITSTNLPTKYSLSQNFPNPFNPSTIITYDLPEKSHVTLKVYDVLGREIRTLVDEEKVTGSYRITLNMQNLPSGIYFYQMITNNYREVKKMNLLK